LAEILIMSLPPDKFYTIWRERGNFSSLRKEIPMGLWTQEEVKKAFLAICENLNI